jgi:hypothetical protein
MQKGTTKVELEKARLPIKFSSKTKSSHVYMPEKDVSMKFLLVPGQKMLKLHPSIFMPNCLIMRGKDIKTPLREQQ